MMQKIRVGYGYDVHRLVEGRSLTLGGIRIPSSRGLLGHSDADVLLHAIADALLGAAALRDIGFHFPDTDPKYAGADSTLLLAEVYSLLREKNYRVGNVDATIVAESPKLNPFVPQMQERIAELLEVSPEDISIKATTNERMDSVGREEGMTAYAVAFIYGTECRDSDELKKG